MHISCDFTFVLTISSGTPVMAPFNQFSKLLAKFLMACVSEPVQNILKYMYF